MLSVTEKALPKPESSGVREDAEAVPCQPGPLDRRHTPRAPARQPATAICGPAAATATTQLHLYHFLILNTAAFALLTGAWLKGWVGMVIASDQSRMTLVIAGAFLFGLLLCGTRMASLRRFAAALDYPPHSEPRRTALLMRIGTVRHIANNLVLLGLIGTVLGFVIAFSGIEPEMIGDTDRAAEMITQVVGGMGVALYTTLVGAITHIWLYGCYKILEQAATAAWLGEPC